MSIEQLCKIEGIGPSKAIAISAAFEMGKRAAIENAISSSEQISSPQKVFQILYPTLKNLDHEECWVLFLNKTNRLICKEKMTIGGMDSTIIDNRAIIRKALEKKAVAIILVHNHPSGSAQPSNADINQTSSLNKALKTCDLALIDHIIIGEDEYYSFADEQLTKKRTSGSKNFAGVKN